MSNLKEAFNTLSPEAKVVLAISKDILNEIAVEEDIDDADIILDFWWDNFKPRNISEECLFKLLVEMNSLRSIVQILKERLESK